MWRIYADSHLIVAVIPSLILPLTAFIASCAQVLYVKEYNECIAMLENNNKKRLLNMLRVLISAFFAYSAVYFTLLTG